MDKKKKTWYTSDLDKSLELYASNSDKKSLYCMYTSDLEKGILPTNKCKYIHS